MIDILNNRKDELNELLNQLQIDQNNIQGYITQLISAREQKRGAYAELELIEKNIPETKSKAIDETRELINERKNIVKNEFEQIMKDLEQYQLVMQQTTDKIKNVLARIDEINYCIGQTNIANVNTEDEKNNRKE